jgi:hypothetical protein
MDEVAMSRKWSLTFCGRSVVVWEKKNHEEEEVPCWNSVAAADSAALYAVAVTSAVGLEEAIR